MENNSRSIRVIIESRIPFVDNRLDGIAEVVRLEPAEITPEAVRDADALIVRTRTKVNEQLLRGSNVSFVATATIGTDHIDIEWCSSYGVYVANAPGCNAPGVAQYVISSIMSQGYDPGKDTTLGIVGVGHVGSIVEQWARTLGMRVLLCDPPRSRCEGYAAFTDIDTIAREADVITFHTPLTYSGDDPTYHLISADFLKSCRRNPLIINAARGSVADTKALVDAVRAGIVVPPVIDCWEGEPAISRELLDVAAIATPHIAGYSLEGKMRATQMTLDAFTRHFGLPEACPLAGADLTVADAPSARAISESYNPMVDTRRLKVAPEMFESLRDGYDYRPEPR